eukprot:10266900-Karenia_brevis.AAC.1
MGADAVASSNQGRCQIIAISIAKGPRWDPSVIGSTNTIIEILGILTKWEGDGVGRTWIESQWDLDHAPHPWAR